MGVEGAAECMSGFSNQDRIWQEEEERMFARKSPTERGQACALAFLEEHKSTDFLATWTLVRWWWEGQDRAAGIYFSQAKRSQFLDGWMKVGQGRFPREYIAWRAAGAITLYNEVATHPWDYCKEQRYEIERELSVIGCKPVLSGKVWMVERQEEEGTDATRA